MSPTTVHGTSGEALRQAVDEMTRLVDQALTEENQLTLLGPELIALASSDGRRLPRMAAIWLALGSDCLRVAKLAIDADGVVSSDEVEYVFPLMFAVARLLARLRPTYAEFDCLDHDAVPAFLRHYQKDVGLFGHGCDKTRWLGLDVCRRMALETHDAEALERYERTLLRLMDEIIALGGVTGEEVRERDRLRDLISLRRRMEESEAAQEETGGDARIEAFCNPAGPTVFHATAHSHQVWERDPFDVESVHGEAREAFERLVDRVTARPDAGRGRMLLILGESGSGKTHLMRAFRNYLHGNRLGAVGYMQMSSRTDDYSRYALVNLIDSLERPYDSPEVAESGIMRLSDAVAETPGALTPGELEELREGAFEPGGGGADLISPLVDKLLIAPAFRDFDPDLLRVLLYLQRRNPPIKARVLKYLRCEHLNPYDREMLGEIAPQSHEAAPQRMIEQLGRLIWATTQGSLVLLVDQLEDIVNLGEAKERFPRAVDVLRHVVENIPSSVVVIACLEDMYTEIRKHLTRSALDRIERDPDPIRLTSRRSLEEIEQLVAPRLAYLFESLEVRFREDDAIFPFKRADLEKRTNFRTRDVLDWCRKYHEVCVTGGELVADVGAAPVEQKTAATKEAVVALEQSWNDFRTQLKKQPPDGDEALLELVAMAVRACGREFETGVSFACEDHKGALKVLLPTASGKTETLVMGICNKAPQGGWLGKQVEALKEAASPHPAAVIRSSDYPSNPITAIARQLGKLIATGGRRVVMEDSDWRTLLAYRHFAENHANAPGYDAWLRQERPLSQLSALRELLGLDALRSARPKPQVPRILATPTKSEAPLAPPAPTRSVPPAVSRPAPTKKLAAPKQQSIPEQPDQLIIGKTAGVRPMPLSLDAKSLTMHAAVFGMTGSGKTTLALSVLEQLLARGIPALILDRKGDLCSYADPSWGQRKGLAPAAQTRAQRLREQLEVSVYTPGELRGRPLSLPIVPAGLGQLPSHERGKVARQAAYALGKMMGYRENASDNARRVILAKAIETLGASGTDGEIPIGDIVKLIDDQDPSLINAIGRLDPKHFPRLVDHLETLRHGRGDLLAGGGEPLDPDELFGPHPRGKTRLTIISTKGLGDNATVEFWVARMLVEIGRWANRHPAGSLQGIIMMDEADLYMPAVAKPATKEPLQDLLRRARSAGLGLILASQNPGDFDYKSRDNIRTWFVGKIQDATSRNKMKALLADCRVNVAGRLASLETGEFFRLTGGDVVEFKADRSILETEQLSEEALVKLAKATQPAGVAASRTKVK